MDKAKLEAELKDYSIDELELIYKTQQDVYSKEELDYMLKLIGQRYASREEAITRALPEEIECSKCGAPNPFANETCEYCQCKLNKTAYYKQVREQFVEAEVCGMVDGISADEEDDYYEDVEPAPSYFFHYVISFIIPLVGIIMGAIFLTKDMEHQRRAGKICIMLAIVEVVLAGILFAARFKYLF